MQAGARMTPSEAIVTPRGEAPIEADGAQGAVAVQPSQRKPTW